ncbi:MAG: FAD:protein FMN transferase [Prevotella sp.]|nr:FAD:protein FMN transferase [Prevotella sp.]MBQ6208428.1 FAD:protein FMN transferase [Prevotella sp.]
MNKKSLVWQLPFLVLLIVGTVFVIRQQHDMPYQNDKGFIFGTVYNITYQHDKDLQNEIVKVLKQVDASLSPFNKNSIITKVNNNESVALNDMFVDVFTLAKTISAETDGAFDMTVAPLVNAWGFGFKNDTAPTADAIDSLRQLVGFDKVSIVKGKVVKSDPRITLDGSAIAKGYGCDVVARLLRQYDIKNYMIEIGGEVVTCGVSPKRVPWKIGVTKPTEDTLSTNQELQTVLNITDRAMATSGNYRNFYYKDGKRYAHTINPKTGYPIQHNILSATVLAPSCAMADAYATSFMVLGLDESQRILERHPELMAYFIYSTDDGGNAVWFSPSMKGKIVE